MLARAREKPPLGWTLEPRISIAVWLRGRSFFCVGVSRVIRHEVL